LREEEREDSTLSVCLEREREIGGEESGGRGEKKKKTRTRTRSRRRRRRTRKI